MKVTSTLRSLRNWSFRKLPFFKISHSRKLITSKTVNFEKRVASKICPFEPIISKIPHFKIDHFGNRLFEIDRFGKWLTSKNEPLQKPVSSTKAFSNWPFYEVKHFLSDRLRIESLYDPICKWPILWVTYSQSDWFQYDFPCDLFSKWSISIWVTIWPNFEVSDFRSDLFSKWSFRKSHFRSNRFRSKLFSKWSVSKWPAFRSEIFSK